MKRDDLEAVLRRLVETHGARGVRGALDNIEREPLDDAIRRILTRHSRADVQEKLAPGAPGRPGTPGDVFLEAAYARVEARMRVHGESAREAAKGALEAGGLVYQGPASRMQKVAMTGSPDRLRRAHREARAMLEADPASDFATACEWSLHLALAAEEARRDGRDVGEAVMAAALE